MRRNLEPSGRVRRSDEKVLCYIALPLTNLSDLERQEGKELAKDVARLLESKYDMETFIPSDATDPKEHPDISPEDVYLLNKAKVATSDLFVLLMADVPSTGVGQEIEIAIARGIPTIMCAREAGRISRMVQGSFLQVIETIRWRSPAQLLVAIDAAMGIHGSTIRNYRARHRANEAGSMGDIIRQAMNLKGIDETTLAQRVGAAPAQIRYLLRLPEDISNPSLNLLRKIAFVLDLNLGELVTSQGSSPRQRRVLRRVLVVALKEGASAEEMLDLPHQVATRFEPDYEPTEDDIRDLYHRLRTYKLDDAMTLEEP